MASGATLPVFPEFDLRDQTNLATRWEKYMKRFNNLMAAMDVKEKSRKRALLLHYSGEEVNDLFDTLPDTGEDNDYKEACEALTRYFTPKKNVSFEIFKFRNLKQESHETVDEFHTRLQIASKYCEFGDNKEKEIKAQIELGTSNKKLRRYSFRTPGLTLTQLLDYARTLYETERQAKGIEATNHVITSRRTESEHADVHKIQINKQRSPNPRTNKMSQHSKRKPARAKIPTKHTPQRCFRCGYSWPHNNGKCPAEGQKCNNCSKYNHFASVCNSKDKIREQLNQDSTHAIWNDIRSPHSNNNSNCSSDESSDSDENAFTINEVQNQLNTRKKQRSFNANLKIGKSTIPFQIDRGSSVNIIDETTFQRIKKNNPNIVLRKSRKRLFGFGSQTPLPLVGQFECVLE